MTTQVIVSVPTGADYKSVVTTQDTTGYQHQFDVMPGDSFTTYVYGTRWVSVKEHPLREKAD